MATMADATPAEIRARAIWSLGRTHANPLDAKTVKSFFEDADTLVNRAALEALLQAEQVSDWSPLLDGLASEYTLGEIAIITRAGPARLLGLKGKGHLGPGADADVTIYTNDVDRAKMFATPRYVIKAGTLVVEEGQLRRAPTGRRLAVRPEYDAAVTRDLRRYFDEYACVALENYGAEPVA